MDPGPTAAGLMHEGHPIQLPRHLDVGEQGNNIVCPRVQVTQGAYRMLGFQNFKPFVLEGGYRFHAYQQLVVYNQNYGGFGLGVFVGHRCATFLSLSGFMR